MDRVSPRITARAYKSCSLNALSEVATIVKFDSEQQYWGRWEAEYVECICMQLRLKRHRERELQTKRGAKSDTEPRRF